MKTQTESMPGQNVKIKLRRNPQMPPMFADISSCDCNAMARNRQPKISSDTSLAKSG
jgi:hypothetical protein